MNGLKTRLRKGEKLGIQLRVPKLKEDVGPLTTKLGRELRSRLQTAKKNLEITSIDLAVDIARVDYYRVWSDWGFRSLYDYCQEELGFSRKWTYNLRILGYYIMDKRIDLEEVKTIGITPMLKRLAASQPPVQVKLNKTKESNNRCVLIPNYDENPTPDKGQVLHPQVIEGIEEKGKGSPIFALPMVYYHQRGDYDFMVEILEIASRFAGVNWRQNVGRVLLVLADVFLGEYGQSDKFDYEEGPDWWITALERDGWRCQKCGAYSSLHVHHIKRRSAGGTNDLDNLLTLCVKCHNKEHNHVG